MFWFGQKKDKAFGKYVERLAILGQLSCGPTSLLGTEKKKTSRFLIAVLVVVYLIGMGFFVYYTKP